MRSLIIIFVDVCLFLDKSNLIIIPLFHCHHSVKDYLAMKSYYLIIKFINYLSFSKPFAGKSFLESYFSFMNS